MKKCRRLLRIRMTIMKALKFIEVVLEEMKTVVLGLISICAIH